MKSVCEDRANLGDDLSQPGVAHDQPAARSDAVGLVLELVWLHFIEVLETAGRVKHHISERTDDAAACKIIEDGDL